MTSQELIDAIREAGYEARSYSGRGMYGKECVAVSISGQGSFWRLAYEMGRIHGDSTFPDPVLDTLGEGYIVYWPEYAWPEEPDAPEDEYKYPHLNNKHRDMTDTIASDLIAEPDDPGAPYNAV